MIAAFESAVIVPEFVIVLAVLPEVINVELFLFITTVLFPDVIVPEFSKLTPVHVLQYIAVSYTHLTLPTIYSV